MIRYSNTPKAPASQNILSESSSGEYSLGSFKEQSIDDVILHIYYFMVERVISGLYYCLNHAVHSYQLFLTKHDDRIYIMHIDVAYSFFVSDEYKVAGLLYRERVIRGNKAF